MPSYFFHIHDTQNLPDSEGCEFNDITEARIEAARLAGAVLRDNGEDIWHGHDWHMEVVDGVGSVLCRLDFRVTMGSAAP